MQIQYLGEKNFLIKTKLTEITTGSAPRVGAIELNGPGEYEVGDVQIKGFHDTYLFLAEGMNVLYVDNPAGLDEAVAKAIEEDIDVLLLALDEDPAHIKAVVKTMNDIDPKLTIPAADSEEHPFCKEVGGCPAPVNELKLSPKDLLEGERKVVVLHARAGTHR